MENQILQHRLAVQGNIEKAFDTDFDFDIEKGKWQIGMTKQYQGKTYKVGGFNAKGNPLWKLVKDDNGGGKGDDGSKSDKPQQQNVKQVLSQQGSTTVQKNTDQNYKQYEFVGTKQPKDWDGWKKLIGDDVVFDGYRNMYVKGDDGKLKQIGKIVTDDKFYFNKVDGK